MELLLVPLPLPLLMCLKKNLRHGGDSLNQKKRRRASRAHHVLSHALFLPLLYSPGGPSAARERLSLASLGGGPAICISK